MARRAKGGGKKPRGTNRVGVDDEASSVSVPEVVAENIRELIQSRRENAGRLGWSERLADRISRFSGSMAFLWIHAAWFAGWMFVNRRGGPIKAFDPYPFGLLTLVVSLEAIFLSTILLISEARSREMADREAELDLHVNLLAEREATTILRKLARIETALGVHVGGEEVRHVRELTQDTDPMDIAATIEDTVRRDGQRV